MPLCNLQFTGTLSAFSGSPPPKVVRTLLRGTGQSALSPTDLNWEIESRGRTPPSMAVPSCAIRVPPNS